jgi:TP901 family phage tail tape measure protein
MSSRYSIESIFKAKDRFSQPLSLMEKRTNRFLTGMNRGLVGIRKTTKSLDRQLNRSLKVGAVASVGALGTGLVLAARKSIDFEKTLVGAAARFPGVIQKGTKEFSLLEKSARQIGTTTEFSLVQAAQGFNFFAKAGLDARQAIVALPRTVDLATLAELDLGRAVDIATDALGAFGLRTKDNVQLAKNYDRVMDGLATTANSANVDLENIFDTMKEAGALFKTAANPIENFLTLTAKLGDATLKGSRGGTVLKNLMLDLQAPTKEAARELENLKIRTADSEGNFRDVLDILGELGKALDGFGTQEKTGILKRIFGQVPITGIITLIDEGTDSLKGYRQSLIEARGSSSKLAAVMRDQTQGSIDALTSSLEGLGITIFKVQGTSFRDLIDAGTKYVRQLDIMIQKNQDFGDSLFNNVIKVLEGSSKAVFGLIGAFLAFKAVVLGSAFVGGIIATIKFIGAALLVFKSSFLVPIIKGAFALISGLVALIGGWPVIIGIAIAGLVAGLGFVVANWKEVKVFLKDFWKDTVAFTKTAVDKISGYLDILLDPLKLIKEGFGGIFGLFKQPTPTLSGPEFFKLDPFSPEQKAKERGDKEFFDFLEPSLVTPAERISRSFEEKRETSELIIHDPTGRAELRTRNSNPNVRLRLARSGGF